MSFFYSTLFTYAISTILGHKYTLYMSESSEQLKPFDELQERLDAEFEEYMEFRSSETRRGFREAARLGVIQEEGIELEVDKERKELAGLNAHGRVGRILNNFSFWWPGGNYRALFPGRKIMDDLDAVIQEAGYGNIAENIGRKEGRDQEERIRILADVYIRMRDKGYSREELTK